MAIFWVSMWKFTGVHIFHGDLFPGKKAHLHDVDARNVWYSPWNVISVSSLGLLIDENWLFHKLHGFRCAIFFQDFAMMSELTSFLQVRWVERERFMYLLNPGILWICRAQSIRDSLMRWEHPLHCEVHSRRIALLGFLPTSPKKRRKNAHFQFRVGQSSGQPAGQTSHQRRSITWALRVSGKLKL